MSKYISDEDEVQIFYNMDDIGEILRKLIYLHMLQKNALDDFLKKYKNNDLKNLIKENSQTSMLLFAEAKNLLFDIGEILNNN